MGGHDIGHKAPYARCHACMRLRTQWPPRLGPSRAALGWSHSREYVRYVRRGWARFSVSRLRACLLELATGQHLSGGSIAALFAAERSAAAAVVAAKDGEERCSKRARAGEDGNEDLRPSIAVQY